MTLNSVVEGCIIKHACYSFSLRNFLLIKKNYCALRSAIDCPYINIERIARRSNNSKPFHNYYGCDYNGGNK